MCAEKFLRSKFCFNKQNYARRTNFLRYEQTGLNNPNKIFSASMRHPVSCYRAGVRVSK